MTEIFTKLRNGQEVDMRSPEYLPVIEELTGLIKLYLN